MAADYGPILVSGVSGFVGSHVAKHLLESGYRVRGTVRSLTNADKVDPIRNFVPDAKFPIELFEADLTKDEGWAEALEGCRALMHVASPFPNLSTVEFTEDQKQELIDTATQGTLRVLKAASEAKVERVVLTSSIVSICADLQPDKKLYTEEDWADPESADIDPYSKSKIVAEKAAWDFVKDLPDGAKINLAVINPSFIVGPILMEAHKASTSCQFIENMLTRAIPAHPKFGFNMCDVRDVAQAHLKALLNPNAWGHRHAIQTCFAWSRDIGIMLSKEFKPQGYGVPVAHVPNFLVWLSSFVDKRLKYLLPRLGMSYEVDNSRMKEVLGIQPTDLEDSVVDMGYSLIEMGVVKKAKKYKQAGKYATNQEANTPTTEHDNDKEEPLKEKSEENNGKAVQESTIAVESLE